MNQTISEQMKLKRDRQLQRIERANPTTSGSRARCRASSGTPPSSPTGTS